MAKDTTIRGITYQGMESVAIPLASGQGEAIFIDPSGSTLTKGSQMLEGVKSYNPDGTLITGTIPERDESDLTVSGANVTVPAGNYAAQTAKSVPDGSATPPSSISGSNATVTTGTNTITLKKTISVTPTVDAGYVSEGTAGNASVSLTASVTTKAAATITPGTSDQEIAADTYLTGKQTVKGDSNLKSENIVAGKAIFNVPGSAQIPIISYDTSTHVLSIS